MRLFKFNHMLCLALLWSVPTFVVCSGCTPRNELVPQTSSEVPSLEPIPTTQPFESSGASTPAAPPCKPGFHANNLGEYTICETPRRDYSCTGPITRSKGLVICDHIISNAGRLPTGLRVRRNSTTSSKVAVTVTGAAWSSYLPCTGTESDDMRQRSCDVVLHFIELQSAQTNP